MTALTVKPKPEQDKVTGRFVTGNVGGGRYKGKRNLFSEQLYEDFYQDWLAHGIQAIEICRETDPGLYLKIAASLVSKSDERFGGERDAVMEKFIEERRQEALRMIEKMKEPD